MKFLYSLSGANVPVIKEFEINPKIYVKEGQVVCSLVGRIENGFFGLPVGVSAEEHSGKEDILNERANKNKLRVDITQGGVYKVNAPMLTSVSNSNGFYLDCLNGNFNENIVGSKLVLVKKGENSTNSDEIGQVRIALSFSNDGDNYTIGFEGGSSPCIGDVYAVMLNTGFLGMVSDDGLGFEFNNSNNVGLKVVRSNLDDYTLEVMFTNRFFD